MTCLTRPGGVTLLASISAVPFRLRSASDDQNCPARCFDCPLDRPGLPVQLLICTAHQICLGAMCSVGRIVILMTSKTGRFSFSPSTSSSPRDDRLHFRGVVVAGALATALCESNRGGPRAP